jgi:hypothetical protein
MKKYFLLLITAFSFGQNQMISFSQAQSLGFALNAGQSHVNSTQCMTKADALAKYNLSASAMSSYANNQLVPRSAWVNGVAYFTYTMRLGASEGESATCTNNNGQTLTMYSNQSSVSIPMTFYVNTSLTTTYPAGGYAYYLASSNQLVTINNSGQITAISSCQVDTTPPSVPTSVNVYYDTGSNFFVSWQTSTDNVGVVGYEVIDNTGFFQYTTQTSVYINNACGGNHFYNVRAVDAAGNFSAWSNPSNVVNSNNLQQCQ